MNGMDKRYLPEKNICEKIHLNRQGESLALQMFDFICEDRERIN
jgi:hypothetical protein